MADPPDPATPAAPMPVDPTPAQALFGPAIDVIEPLVGLLVTHGVGYQEFARALKPLFVIAARREIEAEGREATDAALSLRAGVQRKDTRALRAGLAGDADAAGETGTAAARADADRRRNLGIAEIVFTRWTTDPVYADPAGGPGALPLTGPAPSFDALVGSVTRDFSRRTVLNELAGLGLVAEDGGTVIPLARTMTPRKGFAEIVRYLADHVGDHLAAGAANVTAVGKGGSAPFLEHSVYGQGLSAESLALLSERARSLWQRAHADFTASARERYDIDRATLPAGKTRHAGRLRFGAYFFSDAGHPAAPGEELEP